MKDSYNKIFKDVKKVLVVFAHPDDMEVVSGGTIKRLTDEGISVRLVVVTNGGRGNKNNEKFNENELSDIRFKEMVNGATILGIKKKEIFNLNLRDGGVENIEDNIEKIVLHIREFKPNLVITHNPDNHIIEYSKGYGWVNHRDHRNVGSITLDACYPFSRDLNFFPEQINNGLNSHSVNRLLLTDSYNLNEIERIEITDYIDFKKKALQSHKLGIGKENVDGFIEDDKEGKKYFEKFKFIEIY